MWGRRKAAEGAGRWESTGGGGLLVRGLVKRGEREREETGRERRRGGGGGEKERETNRFFIFAFQAYLMIFPQTDRQTQRETYTGHTCAFEIVHTPKSRTQPVVITIE